MREVRLAIMVDKLVLLVDVETEGALVGRGQRLEPARVENAVEHLEGDEAAEAAPVLLKLVT